MKKPFQKIGSTLLALTMFAALIPAQAFADEPEAGQDPAVIEREELSTVEYINVYINEEYTGVMIVNVQDDERTICEVTGITVIDSDESPFQDEEVAAEEENVLSFGVVIDVEHDSTTVRTGDVDGRVIGVSVDVEDRDFTLETGDVSVESVMDDYGLVGNGLVIEQEDGGTTEATVGDIEAEVGIVAHAYEPTNSEEDSEGPSIIINAGDISADSDSGFMGAAVSAQGEDASVTLTADSVSADELGIFATSVEGETTVEINGDVTADYGIAVESIYGGTTDICVDGTISGDASSIVLIPNVPEAEPGNVEITAWQIVLDEDGHAVNTVSENDPDVNIEFGIFSPELEHDERAEELEKNIQYIIKVEQPTNGAVLSAVDAEGNALARSHDFDVANENDKVILKIDLEAGYTLTGAYNGLGEKQELLIDEDGNYYVIVPRGGGIYLSVEVQMIVYPQELLTVKSSDGSISLRFFDNLRYEARLADGRTERGSYKLENGSITLIGKDGVEMTIDENGDLVYLFGNDEAARYELHFEQSELDVLMAVK